MLTGVVTGVVSDISTSLDVVGKSLVHEDNVLSGLGGGTGVLADKRTADPGPEDPWRRRDVLCTEDSRVLFGASGGSDTVTWMLWSATEAGPGRRTRSDPTELGEAELVIEEPFCMSRTEGSDEASLGNHHSYHVIQ